MTDDGSTQSFLDQRQSFLDQRAALAGKVALVAGGGGGLGQAIALDLARAGMHLAICDRDADALEETATEAREIGARVVDGVLDVRDSDALSAFFEIADGAFETLDVLVNVVGGTFRSDFVDVSAKGVDTLIRTNFTWVTEAIQLAATRMQRTGGGSIMTITSIEAHRAAPRYAVYAAMKAAVTHLSKILAVELGPARIRVNCIAPDIVPTVGMGRLLGAGGRDADDPVDAVQIPLARKGHAEDVGNCALFLASDLSSYITGTTLHPDGGALASSGWLLWPGAGWTARPPAGALGGVVGGADGGAGAPDA
jgi:NAD(P)-dependent dehydrogenase (short-subunit alcohol dehydrogenase family)